MKSWQGVVDVDTIYLTKPHIQLPRPLYAHVVTEKPDGKSRTHGVQARNGDMVVGHKPPFYADEMGLTSDKYVPLNSTVDHLPLKLTISSMSLQRCVQRELHLSLRDLTLDGLSVHCLAAGCSWRKWSSGYNNSRKPSDFPTVISTTSAVWLPTRTRLCSVTIDFCTSLAAARRFVDFLEPSCMCWRDRSDDTGQHLASAVRIPRLPQ